MTKRYTGGVVSSAVPTVNAAGASGVYLLSQQADYQSKNNWPPFKVEESLRFRAAASGYLSRTPAAAGNRKTWTWSAWVKRGAFGVDDMPLFDGYSSISNYAYLHFRYASTPGYETIEYFDSNSNYITTTQVFRDPSAWYHIVLAVDTTQSTSANRIKLYVNGTQVTAFSRTSYPTQNTDSPINQAIGHNLGRWPYIPTYLDGYMSEVNFVDGLQLTPSSFGGTDKDGNWSPIAYTGTYGQNGFYLNFKDNTSATTMGYDYSGNGNNWTLSGFNVSTANTSYDIMIDVPEDQDSSNVRSNYCTVNPLGGTGITASFYLDSGNLNLNVTNNSGYRNLGATFSPEGFKGYFEITATTSTNFQIGFTYESIVPSNNQYQTTGTVRIIEDGNVRNGNSNLITGCTPAFSSGDILQIAFDFTGGARNVWFGRNGTWGNNSVGGVGVPSTGTNPALTISDIAQASRFHFGINTGAGAIAMAFNFGQRPFTYTPPSGFKSLNTFNLPEPTIKQPNKHFDINLWTGNGGTQAIVNSGSMQPGMIWIKTRNQANYHCLQDIVRGTDGTLFPNATAAEETNQPRLSSFNSNGFTLTSKNDANGSGDTFVGWQWNAGTANVTNTSGSVTSQVRNNPTAGFSVVTYNTGSAGTQTVGHGLGVTPAMIWIKSRINSTAHWDVWHKSFANPAQGYMYLNLLNAVANDARNYSNTAPTSSLFTYESGYEFTANQNYVAYFWAEIEGYSKFSSYVGNGSADGPFVYTGFRPKFIMMKNSTTAGTSRNWAIIDSTRSYANAGNHTLAANLADASSSFGTGVDVFGAANVIDILSNGFKIRDTGVFANTSGDTYIYMAFAEMPFKYARSR